MHNYRTETIIAGILFITATGATMVSQTLTMPILLQPNPAEAAAASGALFVTAIGLEIVNALASAGIAIALFPILWLCARTLAPAYAVLRAIEASIGVFAAIGLFLLLKPETSTIAIAVHDIAFRQVLLVFSVSTLVLYPALWRYRLVPVIFSVWGLIGGVMLLASCLAVLFGVIEFGDPIETLLSLPIWINEMALALWLILRGVDMSRATLS